MYPDLSEDEAGVGEDRATCRRASCNVQGARGSREVDLKVLPVPHVPTARISNGSWRQSVANRAGTLAVRRGCTETIGLMSAGYVNQPVPN